jgi:cytochrome oxidase assembly protein ShyY1
MGETLRGMLLNAYAFWKLGQIAAIASIVSFVGAGVMLLLSALGFWHLRRVSPETEVLPGLGARTPAPVEQ